MLRGRLHEAGVEGTVEGEGGVFEVGACFWGEQGVVEHAVLHGGQGVGVFDAEGCGGDQVVDVGLAEVCEGEVGGGGLAGLCVYGVLDQFGEGMFEMAAQGVDGRGVVAGGGVG